jgi:hypothetical protein
VAVVKRMSVVGALLAVLMCSGCATPPAASQGGGTPVPAPPATMGAPATATVSQVVTGAADAHPALSAGSIALASKLGGHSHKGATLYAVVITEDASETVARKRLNEAIPFFGDTADYFIVQSGDAFAGLDASQFVVLEANKTAAGARDAAAWWDGRVDALWYSVRVVKVKVLTSDPIPVVGTDVEKGS